MTIYKKIFGIFITFFFFLSSLPIHQAFSFENTALVLPVPGVMVTPSKPLVPIMLKGLQINPKDPLIFDFLVSKGDVTIENEQYTQEIERLARYFLASMAIPEKDLWVNLSPFEKENIITDALSKTEMGQSMLSQDYMLKQLTASMIYPEKALGKKFWGRVYEQAKVQFGDVNVPINTFNKVWILADTANAVEKDNAVLITDAHLKVMLEEDFLALQRNQGREAVNGQGTEERQAVANVIRQIILPEIEKEVNQGANFAPLRQVFNAFVLSVWYKKNLQQSLLSQVYTDKSKLSGIEADDLNAKQKIYDRYVQAYKKGVFNYIKEVEGGDQKRIPRKYFSGGEVFSAQNINFTQSPEKFERVVLSDPIDLARVKFDAAMRIDTRGNVLSVIDRANTDNLPDEVVEILERKGRDITEKTITAAVLEDTKALGVEIRVKVNEIADADNMYNGEQIIQNGYIIEYLKDPNEVKAIIYVTSSFKKTITERNFGLFYFFARKIFKIYSEIGNEGRQQEVDFIRAKINLEKQKPKIKSKIEKALMERIPEESFPWILLERELRALLINPTLSESERTEEYFQQRVKEIFPDRKFRKIIPPGLVAYQASEEAYRLLKNNANLKLINAMDGVANYADELPSTVEGMIERLKSGKTISLAFGASKYNPSSIAHISLTLDGTFSQSGASNYIVNVTLEDVRKPSVKKSAKSRLKLAKADIEGIFKSLFTILDVHEPVNGHELGKYNGEEVFYLILKALIPFGLKGSQYYVAGEDHYFVWTPLSGEPNSKFIQWDLMKDENVRQHYTFYVEMFDGIDWKVYQELVRKQEEESEKKGPSAEYRSFYSDQDSSRDQSTKRTIIKEIIEAGSKEQLLDVMRNAPSLPRLDTAGKAIIINNELNQHGVKAVLVLPQRHGARGYDALRDEMIGKRRLLVMPMEGIKHTVSATINREFLELISLGIFDFNHGYGLTMETMENMNKDPEIFRILVRQSNVKLPLALQLLMPETSPLKETSNQTREEFKNLLFELGFTFEEGITESGKESFVKVIDQKNAKEIVIAQYQIVNGLDEHEGGKLKDKNTVEFSERTVLDKNNANAQEALKLLETYVKRLNDAAMSTKEFIEEVENTVGGIELNQNDFKLNVTKDGQGVQFDIDPELLQQFQSEDFSGFKPTVLGITPMTVARPMVQ